MMSAQCDQSLISVISSILSLNIPPFAHIWQFWAALLITDWQSETVVPLLRSSCLIPCGCEGSLFSVPPHIRSHIQRGSGDVKKKNNKKISQSAEQRWHIKLRRYYSSHDVSEAAVSWWQASLRTAWVECISAPSKNPPYNLWGAMGDILAQCLRELLKERFNVLEKGSALFEQHFRYSTTGFKRIKNCRLNV